MFVPGYLDRYPAKMVGHLAETLVTRYADGAASLLDPFCGSGAILQAAARQGIRVVGIDINPYAILLSRVKLHSFDATRAFVLWRKLQNVAKKGAYALPVEWDAKHYWFTATTLQKYECIRYAFSREQLNRSREGAAILLAFALSVRRCSRADQRSPKPFISAYARKIRLGKHFDPFREIEALLAELATLYANRPRKDAVVVRGDACKLQCRSVPEQGFTHAITSPPYINAQDYFRNTKLELYLLQDLVPFHMNGLPYRFVGTERGLGDRVPSAEERSRNLDVLSSLRKIERTHASQACVVHRYISDMHSALASLRTLLARRATLVIVCGDNLVGGHRISTWSVLNQLAEMEGFECFDSFGDDIARRYLPPRRVGHKGLIKREVVTAFRLVQ